MKLINISKKGTLKFELSDGRFITSYNSGYVRINCGGLKLHSRASKAYDRIYQINKVRKVRIEGLPNFIYNYERILIHCPQKRYEYIKAWVNRNIK